MKKSKKSNATKNKPSIIQSVLRGTIIVIACIILLLAIAERVGHYSRHNNSPHNHSKHNHK